MSESSQSSSNDSPSDVFFRHYLPRVLHPVTWLVVLAALLHLVGDVVDAVANLDTYFRTGLSAAGRDTSLSLVLASIAHAFAYSLLFFGTAGTVEFLFRIWDELRTRRRSGGTPG